MSRLPCFVVTGRGTMLVYDRHKSDSYYLIRDGVEFIMHHELVLEYIASGGTIKNLELVNGVLHSDFDIQRDIYISKLSLLYGIEVNMFPTEEGYPYISFMFTRDLPTPIVIDWSKLSPSLNFRTSCVAVPIRCTVKLDTSICACSLHESYLSIDITDLPYSWLFNKFISDEIYFVNGAELIDRSLRAYPEKALGYLLGINSDFSTFRKYESILLDSFMFLFRYDKSKLLCTDKDTYRYYMELVDIEFTDLVVVLRQRHFSGSRCNSELSDEFIQVFGVFERYFLACGSSDKIYKLFRTLLADLQFIPV